METSTHPSIEGLRRAIKARGGTAVCRECGGEELSLEQVAPMNAVGGYGFRRFKRADLVCENCGHVMGYEVEKLQADG